VALALASTSIAVVYGILRSRSGLALTAIGDDEAAARSLGVSPARLKLLVYLIAAQGAGMTGALVYWQKARISPDAAFSLLDWTANVLFTVVIGGGHHRRADRRRRRVLWPATSFSAYGPLYLAALGAMAIAVVTFFRRGLWGAFAERFGASLFPIRRQLMSDSAIAPTRRWRHDKADWRCCRAKRHFKLGPLMAGANPTYGRCEPLGTSP
jgi:branched-chain amino acid transport system permease protein